MCKLNEIVKKSVSKFVERRRVPPPPPPPNKMKRNENLSEYRENDGWKLNIARKLKKTEKNGKIHIFYSSRELKYSENQKKANQTKKSNGKSTTYSHRCMLQVCLIGFRFFVCCSFYIWFQLAFAHWIGIEFSSYLYFISFLCFLLTWIHFCTSNVLNIILFFFVILICNDLTNFFI